MRLGDFDYPLDPDRIAQEPAARRDESRLMVLRRRSGETELHRFAELPSLLREGDLLVVNDTRVIPARFFCRRASGGAVEGLFLREQAPAGAQGGWLVLLKGAGRCRIGEKLELIGGEGAKLELVESRGQGQWLVRPEPSAPVAKLLAKAGRTPLPPYIRREGEQTDGADRDRYQTIYAAADGAVAAPTAGLHFTPEVFAALSARGIETTAVTLHVGLGTFAPVKVEDPAAHRMHSEWYEMPAPAAEAINTARRDGRRVVAVGTTSVRVLETVATADGRVEPGSGWTDIFLYPPAEFRAVDALITNFHLPRSTLLMLVAAFCSPGKADGIEMVRHAYARAADEGFRFFSYGDAMLIL
jgi:S-adenosylmethionine:tRNA ribosyltransferase-isomerase